MLFCTTTIFIVDFVYELSLREFFPFRFLFINTSYLFALMIYLRFITSFFQETDQLTN